MIELFKVGHLLKSPQGLVLGGANPKLNEVEISELQSVLKKLDTISLSEKTGKHQVVGVKDVKVSSSVGDNINIHLLLHEKDLRALPSEGTVVYCDDRADLLNLMHH